MPVTAAHLETNFSDTSASSYDTGSISLSANTLVLATVSNSLGAGATLPTLTGASRTWTQVATKLDAGALRRITVFRSLSGSANSGVLTIDFGGTSQTRAEWSISEFANVDTGGSNGANAVVQSADATVSGTNAGITVTLGAFSSVNNATWGGARHGTITSGMSVGSGFTELGEATSGGSILGTEWRNDNDTSVDWTWTSGTVIGVAIALELKFASTAVKDIIGMGVIPFAR